MRERPILFSTPMVKAILEGRKTQTRRIVKPQPDEILHGEPYWNIGGFRDDWKPWGIKGNCLWVKETWSYATDFGNSTDHIFYRASYKNGGIYDDVERWKPSIHMPRHASRITLEITNVRIERLQEITEVDAIKEGVNDLMPFLYQSDEWQNITPNRARFAGLWDSINDNKYSWDSNPYVWVIEFQRRED